MIRYLYIIFLILIGCSNDPNYRRDGVYLLELYKVELNGDHFSNGSNDKPLDLLVQLSYSNDKDSVSQYYIPGLMKPLSYRGTVQMPGHRGTHQLSNPIKWSIIHNQNNKYRIDIIETTSSAQDTEKAVDVGWDAGLAIGSFFAGDWITAGLATLSALGSALEEVDGKNYWYSEEDLEKYNWIFHEEIVLVDDQWGTSKLFFKSKPCKNKDSDNKCDEIDDCVSSFSDNLTDGYDCNKVCNGKHEYDDCGDCNSPSNFNLAKDDCGVCDGNNKDLDCNGDCFGEAFYDACGICSDGNSDHDANSDIDECGICFGSGIPDKECDCNGNVLDCAGDCGGGVVFDECGICGGDGIPTGQCDCNGNVLDECGVCGGQGVDADKDGICDDIDACVGKYDCNNECNGQGIDIDKDGICDDIDDCVGEYDCNNKCNGKAVVDECGICDGDGSSCAGLTLSFGSISNDSIEILFNTPYDVAGFQFNVEGTQLSDASGGLAAEADFTVSVGGNTVLGFSFTGSVIPSGSSGVLTSLQYVDHLDQICLNGVVLSDPYGSAIEDYQTGDCIIIK